MVGGETLCGEFSAPSPQRARFLLKTNYFGVYYDEYDNR